MTAAAKKVIVVEDYRCMLDLMGRYLDELGFANVFTERDPYEALATARREQVDLIISDYSMPGMNGLELLESVRGDPLIRDAKFIMLSGADDWEIVRQAVALGVDEFVHKPVSRRVLNETVRRLFDEPARRRPDSPEEALQTEFQRSGCQ